MLQNRSLPPGSIFPELAYADFRTAVQWLCRVFGFMERIRIADHRSQLILGEASTVVVARTAREGGRRVGDIDHSVMVRVEDVDRHYEHAMQNGAAIIRPPETYAYGERQYTADDLEGHRWTFTQSVADVLPEEWGGQSISLESRQPAHKVVGNARMDHLALPVAQCNRSRDWYIRHLSLQLEFEIPERKTVALRDDADLTIFFYEKPEAPVMPSCTLTFQVSDVDAKYLELSANGVVFEKSPQKLMWGYGAELRDPDGYMIYLWDETSMREKGNT